MHHFNLINSECISLSKPNTDCLLFWIITLLERCEGRTGVWVPRGTVNYQRWCSLTPSFQRTKDKFCSRSVGLAYFSAAAEKHLWWSDHKYPMGPGLIYSLINCRQRWFLCCFRGSGKKFCDENRLTCGKFIFLGCGKPIDMGF